MIELLNSRKMVILVMILVFACILIIILEGILTENTSDNTRPVSNPNVNLNLSKSKTSKESLDAINKKKIDEIKNAINKTKLTNHTKEETNSEKLENTSMCWLNEKHLVKVPCSPCTEFEQLDKHQSACENTGYKELVKCEISGEVYRSCILLNDSRSFWSFQLASMFVSFAGYILLSVRNKQLDRKWTERFRRSLQNSYP